MKPSIQNNIKTIIEAKKSVSLLFDTGNQINQMDYASQICNLILNISKSTASIETNPDIFIIKPIGRKTKSIGITQIHDLINKIKYKPYYHSYKIGIVLTAERMTSEAQNALLKTLEEPPQFTILILFTDDKKILIPTILSRTQIINLYNYQEIENQDQEISSFLCIDFTKRLKYIDELLAEKDKEKQDSHIQAFLTALLGYYRITLKDHITNEHDKEQDIRSIQIINLTQEALSKNVNKKLALENLFINLPQKAL